MSEPRFVFAQEHKQAVGDWRENTHDIANEANGEATSI